MSKRDTVEKRLKQQQFIQKFLHHGKIAPACHELEISVECYYKWMQRDKHFQNEMEKLFRSRFRIAKGALFSIIMDPDHKDHYNAVKSILSKDPEWMEHQNLNVAARINVNISAPQPNHPDRPENDGH